MLNCFGYVGGPVSWALYWWPAVTPTYCACAWSDGDARAMAVASSNETLADFMVLVVRGLRMAGPLVVV